MAVLCKALCLPLKLVQLVFLLLNLAILVLGVICIVTGVLAYNNQAVAITTFSASPLANIILGSVCAACGLLGFVTICTSNPCLGSCYMTVMFIVGIPVLVFGILCVVFALNILPAAAPGTWVYTQLRNGWTTGVTYTPEAICSFQQSLSCSGFTSSCAYNTNDTAAECPPNCSANSATTSCFVGYTTQLQQQALRLGYPSIAVGAAMIATAIMTCIFSCVGCCIPSYVSNKGCCV